MPERNFNTDPWSLSSTNTAWVHKSNSPKKPILKIIYDGRSPECIEYLRECSMDGIWPDKVAVTFRSQSRGIEINEEGVLGVTNPAGDYLLELKANTSQVFEFVTGVHQYAEAINEEEQYYLWIEAEDGLVMDWAAEALMVFAANGQVIWRRSLLPTGLDT